MSDSASAESSTSNWQVPALLASLLTVLGLQFNPKGGETTKPPVNATVEHKLNPVVDYSDPQYRELDSSEKLIVLQPLRQFYWHALTKSVNRDTSIKPDADKNILDQLKIIKTTNSNQFKVIISVLPDPDRSGMGFSHDTTLQTTMKAFFDAGYVPDGQRIPWSIQEMKSEENSNKYLAAIKGDGIHVDRLVSEKTTPALPGSILFRKSTDVFDGEKVKNDLVLLLLVTESPISGVSKSMLLSSIRLACEMDCDNPIRIVGPNYSGSESSITNLLDHLLTKRIVCKQKILWNNGGASAIFGNLSCAYQNNNGHLKFYDEQVHFQNFSHSAKQTKDLLWNYIINPCMDWIKRPRVAIVQEGTTGYSSMVKGASNNSVSRFEQYNYQYPYNIADLRSRIAIKRKQQYDPSFHLSDNSNLDLDIETNLEKSENIIPRAPEILASMDELRLLEIVEDIKSRGIRYVFVNGSDIRDRMFVAQFIKENCPDVQLLLANPWNSLNQKSTIGYFRGAIATSSYPMSEMAHDNNFISFAAANNYAIYHATLAHLSDGNSLLKEKLKIVLKTEDTDNCNYCKYGVPENVHVVSVSQAGFQPLQSGSRNNSAKLFNFLTNRSLTSGVTPILPLIIGMFSLIVLGWLYSQKNQTKMHLDLDRKFHFSGDIQDFDPESQVVFCKFQMRVRHYYNIVFPDRIFMSLIKPQKLPVGVAATFAIIYCITSFTVFYCEHRVFLKSVYIAVNNFIFVIFFYKSGRLFMNWMKSTRSTTSRAALKCSLSCKKSYYESITLSMWLAAASLIMISVNTIEPGPFSLTSLVLKLNLLFMFTTVLFQWYYLRLSWSRFNELMTASLCLPFTDHLEKLPRHLTDIQRHTWHFWTHSGDDELKRRLRLYLNNLYIKNPHDESEPGNGGGGESQFKSRDPKNTFAILKEWIKPKESSAALQKPANSPKALSTCDDKTEIYLAAELVYYLNRCDDYIWDQLIALVLNCLCLFFYFNSYPFQPAGTMLNWICFLLFVSGILIVRVIYGLGSHTFFKKIDRSSSGSVFKFDLFNKIIASFGPILMVLTALSFGLADILRILLGPLVR